MWRGKGDLGMGEEEVKRAKTLHVHAPISHKECINDILQACANKTVFKKRSVEKIPTARYIACRCPLQKAKERGRERRMLSKGKCYSISKMTN